MAGNSSRNSKNTKAAQKKQVNGSTTGKKTVKVKFAPKPKPSKMPVILLAAFVAYTIFAIIFAVNGLGAGVSFPAVGIFVLLEAGLAALLFPVALWIHGLVFLAQIIAGIGFHMLPFMILMDIIYALGVALIYFWTRKERAVY